MSTTIKHYLDGDFISDILRDHDLEATLKIAQPNKECYIMLAFNTPIRRVPLLPDEARQLAESLSLLAEEADRKNDDKE